MAGQFYGVFRVATDPSSNIVVTGYFDGTISFGDQTLVATDMVEDFVVESFLAKLTP